MSDQSFYKVVDKCVTAQYWPESPRLALRPIAPKLSRRRIVYTAPLSLLGRIGRMVWRRAASVYAMSALSDLLKSANVSGQSARAIARAAKEKGFSLNHDTAARYLRGDHGRPDEQTLVALAAVLPVPIGQLRKAADLPSEQTEPYLPPAEASR